MCALTAEERVAGFDQLFRSHCQRHRKCESQHQAFSTLIDTRARWVQVPQARTIWIADAHGYGKRFIVRADEMLTAFVELQRPIHEFAVNLIS